MYVAQVRVEIAKIKRLRTQNDTIQWLLGCWRSSGQVLGREFIVLKEDDSWKATVGVPARDALRPRHNCEYAQRVISEEFPKAGLAPASTQIIGSDPPGWAPCTCKTPSSYALFTDLLSMESPLQCLDCGKKVPLYRVPWPNSDQCQHVIWWQSNYQACDTLNMDCGFSERFGERQMSDWNSELTKKGRKICTEIEKLTGKPVFYYLYRHHGKSWQIENERCCPSCGGAWKLPELLHQLYDFKCDRCCLLSNVALSIRNQ